MIATNSDHSVILYDVASGARIGAPIRIADDESNWIALSLDGRRLAVGGEADKGHNATQIWDLEPEAWVAAACRLAGRNLTPEEWSTHIGALAAYGPTCPGLPPDA
jgi:hypothetical protein